MSKAGESRVKCDDIVSTYSIARVTMTNDRRDWNGNEGHKESDIRTKRRGTTIRQSVKLMTFLRIKIDNCKRLSKIIHTLKYLLLKFSNLFPSRHKLVTNSTVITGLVFGSEKPSPNPDQLRSHLTFASTVHCQFRIRSPRLSSINL